MKERFFRTRLLRHPACLISTYIQSARVADTSNAAAGKCEALRCGLRAAGIKDPGTLALISPLQQCSLRFHLVPL
ncbi:unnamed protein product [Lota lota]